MSEKFEAWVAVHGYEGLYEVSDLGRVKRIGKAARTGKGRGGGARIGLILKPQKRKGGYIAVQLWKDGEQKQFLVHCVVATAFLGPAPVGKEVNHDDGNKKNCAVSNLEYLTRAENMKHAYRTGLRAAPVVQTGERHHNAKLNWANVRTIRRRYEPGICGLSELAREFGVDHTTIYSVVHQQTWREA